MKEIKKVMKALFLELAKYAGATVVVGLCMWLILCGVILLSHTPRKTTQKTENYQQLARTIFA